MKLKKIFFLGLIDMVSMMGLTSGIICSFVYLAVGWFWHLGVSILLTWIFLIIRDTNSWTMGVEYAIKGGKVRRVS